MSFRVGGIRPWVVQRVSAAYMLVYLIVALVYFGSQGFVFSNWLAWFTSLPGFIAAVLCGLALLLHGWIGGRDILMDYVSHGGLRFLLLVMLAFYLMVLAVWLIVILGRVAL